MQGCSGSITKRRSKVLRYNTSLHLSVFLHVMNYIISIVRKAYFLLVIRYFPSTLLCNKVAYCDKIVVLKWSMAILCFWSYYFISHSRGICVFLPLQIYCIFPPLISL